MDDFVSRKCINGKVLNSVRLAIFSGP